MEFALTANWLMTPTNSLILPPGGQRGESVGRVGASGQRDAPPGGLAHVSEEARRLFGHAA